MRHSEKTVLSYRFTSQHSQKALKYRRIPSFFAVVARQIGYGQNCTLKLDSFATRQRRKLR